MSLLAEVAARADVPVEGVIRVFTRQPVSRRIERRVVEVLDSLDPEQLRAVERLARAGTPDVVPLGSELATTDEPLPAPVAAPDPGTALTAPESALATAPEGALATGDDELMVELGRLLSELAVGINEIRHDLVGARQDRVDDLAVLVDLMTTGWRGVDRRLGRLERMVTRLEAVRDAPQAQLVAPRELDRPVEVVPLPPPSPPEEPGAPAEPVAPPPEEPRRPLWRRLLAPAVPLLFVAVLVLALLAFELIGSSDDDPRLQPALESAGQQETQRREEPTTSVSSTTGGPVTEAPPVTTGTTTRATPPATTGRTTPATPPATTGRTTPATPPATTGRTTTGTPPPAPTEGITPSRVFAWPASAGTSYYLFRIYRGTKLIHEAHPTTARLVLPPSVKFTEGAYRWSVRPGVGPRSQNQLGAPIVDSRFEVSA